MTETSALGFFDLSTELRLEVYRHLVIECLATGCPEGLSGLLFSCREVHHELEAEFISRTRPLLIAQAGWKKAGQGDASVKGIPLRMKPSHQDLISNAALTKLTIALPTPHSWSFCMRSCYDIPSFQQLMTSLRPILRLRWSVLTIKFCLNKFAPHLDFKFAAKLSEGFFLGLARLEDDGECELSLTDRLVLNFGNADYFVDGKSYFHEHFEDIQNYDRDDGNPHVMPPFKRGWVARVQAGAKDEQGWKMAIDYRDDLEEFEGALWKIEKEEGRGWKVKRHSKGSEEVGDFEYGHIVDTEDEWQEEDDEDDIGDVDSDEEDGSQIGNASDAGTWGESEHQNEERSL